MEPKMEEFWQYVIAASILFVVFAIIIIGFYVAPVILFGVLIVFALGFLVFLLKEIIFGPK